MDEEIEADQGACPRSHRWKVIEPEAKPRSRNQTLKLFFLNQHAGTEVTARSWKFISKKRGVNKTNM